MPGLRRGAANQAFERSISRIFPKARAITPGCFDSCSSQASPIASVLADSRICAKKHCDCSKRPARQYTTGISKYLEDAQSLNESKRPIYYAEGYTPELRQLVAEKDKYLVDRFDYEFSGAERYPKADFFRRLGSANVDALIERVKGIPEDLWKSENEEKPNKLSKLNDTRHVVFRFVDGFGKSFDFHDLPLWEVWKDDLLPIMETAANALGYEDYRFPRVMFARLPAGGEISPHKDTMASHYVHKIHVPLITNPRTIFHVGTKSEHLPTGGIVEVNNKRGHAVYNRGDEDRIHLIFECYSMEDYGKKA